MSDFQQKWGIPEDLAVKILGEATQFRTNRLFDEAQSQLAKLGSLAIPPRGHSCPTCSIRGTLYCYNIAVERIRGTRND